MAEAVYCFKLLNRCINATEMKKSVSISSKNSKSIAVDFSQRIREKSPKKTKVLPLTLVNGLRGNHTPHGLSAQRKTQQFLKCG